MNAPSCALRMPLLLAVLALAAGPAAAQTLADLQPGRNFTSTPAFGAARSADLDPGDCDNDGDLDVIVANGVGGPAQNTIWINMGGAQGGTPGTFTDQTATRFAGVAVDSSRDIEFVDFDNDGDLDIAVANRGSPASGGEPGRFYVNLGGLQGGTIGFYAEETDTRWGSLVSVPASQQILGGNAGPFREYSGDCDFADLDDDGDSDLVYTSFGPAMDGTHDSRVFLNDGTGVFDELYPWANAGADIQTHTLDTDLVDLDGDFDIDIVASSKSSQARTYLNNLHDGLGPELFTDITQTALIDPVAVGSETANSAVECGDVDGDGDFDLWMVDYSGHIERVLRNEGVTPGAGFSFTMPILWIQWDPSLAESEADFLDYDGDGDLDAFIANNSGANWIYQNCLAQGLDFDATGLFHRTGFALGIAPAPETPLADNGHTTLDADVADVDGDGDEDVLVANDNDQGNFLDLNVLGVPDTHAPVFQRVTQQGDKPDGSATVIHAAIRDNSAVYLTRYYDTRLVYAVNGGAPQTVVMFAQGSMQFRGVIPAQLDAVVSYHVECTDLAGNTGTSAVTCFVQGTPAAPWTDLGSGLAGTGGVPVLTATGTLVGLCPLTIALAGARPGSTAGLFYSLGSSPLPFKGGTLVPVPVGPGSPLVLPTGTGSLSLPATMPPGANGLGLQLFLQFAIQDPAAVQGVALSNALRGDIP